MAAVWKRELASYFLTPIGYVFAGFFLLVSGILFTFNNLMSGSGDVAMMLNSFSMIPIFLAPILTMRLFSEERKNKSEQMLLTSPLSLTSIVAGKFLSALTVWLATLAGTLLYVLIIGSYGRLFWGEIISSYVGFFLMGGCFIAIGTLISASTENQVSAAVISIGINFFIWVIDSVIYVVPAEFISTALKWFSLYERYDPFSRSQLGFSGILYFLSFIVVFLFLTIRVIDKRRWSEG
ncbi:MAG: ABC transporter permease [Oscillospiraceae bacterium]|jgi:ABC-2 type transport system permease protein|nr:ABC transporter permease [Oscillospiraceae bacterium]